jgi:dolichol-phosphate mannosyltransferase
MLDEASIIIPTYNELENLPVIIDRLSEVSNKIAEEVEIVIVDDNSPDGTGQEANRLAVEHGNIKVIHRPRKMGVGSAIYEGVMAARASNIVMMDADMHHRPEFVPSITNSLQKFDIVIASRFIEGSGMQASSLMRRLATRFGNELASILLHLDVRDYTHGFRGYRKSTFLSCYRSEDRGGEFNLRILIEARKRNYSIVEVPYRSEHPGKSQIRNWIRYLRLVVVESLHLQSR